MGLCRLLCKPRVREAVVAAFARLKMGDDRFAVKVKARGKAGKYAAIAEYLLHGRDQSQKRCIHKLFRTACTILNSCLNWNKCRIGWSRRLRSASRSRKAARMYRAGSTVLPAWAVDKELFLLYDYLKLEIFVVHIRLLVARLLLVQSVPGAIAIELIFS